MKRLVSNRLRIGLGLLLWLPFPVFAQNAPLQVEQAWVRAGPPGMPMLAGYARFDNHGTQALRLVAVVGDGFELVELHRSEIVDGVSRMRPVPVLEIPAGQSVSLQPGGLHLMLMQPLRMPEEGDVIVLRLQFDNGEQAAAEFTVRRQPPGD